MYEDGVLRRRQSSNPLGNPQREELYKGPKDFLHPSESFEVSTLSHLQRTVQRLERTFSKSSTIRAPTTSASRRSGAVGSTNPGNAASKLFRL